MDKANRVVLELGVGEVTVGEGIEKPKIIIIKKKNSAQKNFIICVVSAIW